MSKRFRCGLIVGKFSPLHRGHELLIERAVGDCEEVIVISYSKPEFSGCDALTRKQWLSELYPSIISLVVTDKILQELSPLHKLTVPNNDDDDDEHRLFCGRLCSRLLQREVDAVFTSEDYGVGFAQVLTSHFRKLNPAATEVQHVMVDRARGSVPISGSRLRLDLHANRKYLSPAVYSSFVKRVCILGGESTGKSTLSAALAEHHQTVYVAEFGRELWEAKNGALTFDDMMLIGRTQVRREHAAAGRATRFLFCDTSPLTTLFYSQHLFGAVDDELIELATRRYDVVVLCQPNFPFVQDGTRQPEDFRMLQHEWYLKELAQRNIRPLIVTGSVSERIQTVSAHLNGQ